MSDPKTPNETPEDKVSDTEHAPDSLENDTAQTAEDVIEDAEIVDEKPTDEEATVDELASENTAEDTIEDSAEDARETGESPEQEPETALDADPQDTTSEQTESATPEAETDRAAEPDPVVEDLSAETNSAKSDPEPDPQPAAAPAPVVVQKKGGFMGPFLGGVVAAGLGFGLCYYLVEQGTIGAPDTSEDIARIAQLESGLASLRTELEGVAGAPTEDPRVDTVAGAVTAVEATVASVEGQIGSLQSGIGTLQSEIGTLQSEIEAQTGLISNLDEQMAAIAALPEGTETVDSAAMVALQASLAQQQEDNAAMQARLAEAATAAQAQMEAAQAEMEAVRERAGALQNETQSAVDEASNRAMVSNLFAALENGTGFAGALDSITVPVPEALSAVAENGVETLLDLQRQFPAAARDGLATSLRATVGDAPQDRVFAFLRAQVGARSLEARDGDDPDAILSRVQEAVNSGQLDVALNEVAALPEEGQLAMSGWTGAAQARVDAIAALDALATEINSN